MPRVFTKPPASVYRLSTVAHAQAIAAENPYLGRWSKKTMRIWTTIGAAVAVSGLIGMAACSSKSSSGGGSDTGCSGLATCCSSLPAADDPSGCTTIANAGDENACDQTITGLHASNNCTGVSAGTSTGGATCAQLLSCCNTGTFPSASLKTDCSTVANGGDDALCASDYPNYVTLNACPALDGGAP